MKKKHKGGGIKMLLMRHCEKGFAGLLALVAVYLVYASLSIEGESRRPQELRDKVTQTSTAFKDAVWSDLKEEDRDLAYDPSNVDAVEITSDKYAGSGAGWNSAVVRPMIDRTDPQLLAAIDLEGMAVTGLMAFVDEGVRDQRALEELRRQEEERVEREKERDKNRGDNPLLGGGRGGAPGMGVRGADDGNGKRRPVPSRIRESGVLTQGDERIQTVSCAVVLAKAPSLAQFNLYKEALEDARDYGPSRDVPNYVGYYLERAEVSGGRELEWSPVRVGSITGGNRKKALTATSLNRMIEDWIPGQEPMVDVRYEHPALTVPLPPLVGQAWGHGVVHSEAPFQVETDAAELKKDAEEQEPKDDGGDDLFAGNSADGNLRGGPMGAPGGGRGAPGGGRMGMMGGPGGRMGGMGMEMGGMGMMGAPGMGGGRMGGGRMGGGGGGGARGTGVFDPEIPFVMVRFFDFSVLPGRQYRYRVRLILKDVNHKRYGVDPRTLAREVTERFEKTKSTNAIRVAEWSEPSPVISVPMAGSVSVAGAKVPSSKQPNAEGSVEMLVQSYALDENQRAIKSGLVESFKRGAVVNMTEDAEFITPSRRWIEEVDSFKFHTGITLCDFKGGEAIGGKFKAPVNVLLMDATGKLFVQNQLDDAQTVTDHKLIYDEDKSNPRGRGGEMGFPGMGRGMEGRGL